MSSGESARPVTVFDIWGPARLQHRPPIARLLLESVRLAWRAGRGELATIAAVQVLSVIGVAAQVLLARALLAGLLHASRAGGDTGTLVPRVLALAAVTAALGVAQAIAVNRQRVLSELCARYGESRVLAMTGAAPLGAFDDSRFHDRVARARVAVQRLPSVVAGLAALGRALAGGLGAFVALLTITPLFAPGLVLVALPGWLAARLRGRAYHRFATGFTPADRERQYLADLLSNREPAKEVRAFGLQDHLRERHDRLWQERIAGLTAVARRQLVFAVGADLLGSALVALTLVLLVALTLNHDISLASAGASAAAIVLLGQRVALAGASAGGLSESALFLQDYLTLVGSATDGAVQPARSQPQPGPLPSRPTAPLDVRAEHVSFTYPGARAPALRDVSLQIAPGEIVALVGENGSGKTTLAKLLAGLYRPDQGRVTWNGVDAADAARDPDHPSVAVIFQDFQRYALSARDNIGLGAVGRLGHQREIEHAASLAGADELILRLPDGYDTLLGPEFFEGVDLSLGQWQRVALARGVFRDAPFVILDEPTAALDAHAEADLFRRISDALDGRGVLLISHRLSSVRRADQILVLDAGAVAERGTHAELLALGGRYAAMFALQAAPYR